MYYQQGDVIVERTDNIKGKKLKHLVLAYGEATGHHHQVSEGEAELYDHESDSGEWQNLAESAEHAKTRKKLRRLLHAHFDHPVTRPQPGDG